MPAEAIGTKTDFLKTKMERELASDEEGAVDGR
jgi:hypothetical protein